MTMSLFAESEPEAPGVGRVSTAFSFDEFLIVPVSEFVAL
jgi:hypothetical protein